MGVSIYYIATRALDLITVILPPALPATLSVGIAAAVRRLRKERIMCINTGKINVFSKVDRFCLDKTGTLTEEGLRIYRTILFEPSSAFSWKIFEQRNRELACTSIQNIHLHCLMTVCHGLRSFEDELIGDPLEIEMVNFSRFLAPLECTYQAEECNMPLSKVLSLSHDLLVLKELEFCHELRRMSVVVKRKSAGKFYVYTKGSPENIKCICRHDSCKLLFVLCRALIFTSASRFRSFTQ